MKYKSLIDLMEAFPNEASCVAHLERLRWPKGIICLSCSSPRKVYRVTRGNNYKCSDCKSIFSVRKGTIFEESRLPLRKWFMAAWLITNHRKGISSCQLAREVCVTQKTAWFMLGRLREVADAMGESGGRLAVHQTNPLKRMKPISVGKSVTSTIRKNFEQGEGPLGSKRSLVSVNVEAKYRPS